MFGLVVSPSFGSVASGLVSVPNSLGVISFLGVIKIAQPKPVEPEMNKDVERLEKGIYLEILEESEDYEYNLDQGEVEELIVYNNSSATSSAQPDPTLGDSDGLVAFEEALVGAAVGSGVIAIGIFVGICVCLKCGEISPQGREVVIGSVRDVVGRSVNEAIRLLSSPFRSRLPLDDSVEMQPLNRANDNSRA